MLTYVPCLGARGKAKTKEASKQCASEASLRKFFAISKKTEVSLGREEMLAGKHNSEASP
jgi:hypothetical protein